MYIHSRWEGNRQVKASVRDKLLTRVFHWLDTTVSNRIFTVILISYMLCLPKKTDNIVYLKPFTCLLALDIVSGITLANIKETDK